MHRIAAPHGARRAKQEQLLRHTTSPLRCAEAAAVEAGVKDEPQEGAGAKGDAEAEEEEQEPARKKARRGTGRRRLDPIVREALMAAEQGRCRGPPKAGCCPGGGGSL
jgi:hypothetical protein